MRVARCRRCRSAPSPPRRGPTRPWGLTATCRSPTAPCSPRRAARSGMWSSRRRGGRCVPASHRESRMRTSPLRPPAVATSSGSTSRATRRLAALSDGGWTVRRWPRRSPGPPARAPRRRRAAGVRAAPRRRRSASMASNAWLVTTTSAWPAVSRAFSAKQSVPNGQRAAPMHSRGRDADLPPRPVRHARSQLVAIAGLGGRRPRDESLHVTAECGGRRRVEQFFLRADPPVRLPTHCESCSGTDSFRAP